MNFLSDCKNRLNLITPAACIAFNQGNFHCNLQITFPSLARQKETIWDSSPTKLLSIKEYFQIPHYYSLTEYRKRKKSYVNIKSY